MPGSALDDRLVGVGQQPVAVRHAGQQREVGLGDAVGQVGAVRLAPGRHFAAVQPDHAGHPAARMHRPAQAVERRRIVVVHAPARGLGLRVARPADLVGHREFDRLAEALLRIHGRALYATVLGPGHNGHP